MSESTNQEELRKLDAEVAAMIEPKPPLAHCRSMHDTASPLGAWIHTHIYDHGDECEVVPRVFSSDISLTMKVVEKMRAEGWSFACTIYKDKLPYASFCKGTVASSRNAEAETLPIAICRAALQALDHTQGETWLKCSLEPGMLPDEYAVEIETANAGRVSLFAHKNKVDVDRSLLRVTLLDDSGDAPLVRLPAAPFEIPSQNVRVNRDHTQGDK